MKDLTGAAALFLTTWFLGWINLMFLLTWWQSGELWLLACGLLWAIPTVITGESLVRGVHQLASAR